MQDLQGLIKPELESKELNFHNTKNKVFFLSIFIIFLFLGFLVYGQSLNNPFILDDNVQILNNSHIKSLSELPSFFSSSTMESSGSSKMSGIYYKPLMTSYYALIWNFYDANPFAFHLPLLLVHILSSYFIFLFTMNFLPWTYSLLLGLFFLWHPANSEAVLYIADAQDLFYFFFGILSLYCIQKIQNSKALFISLIFLFSAGLLSKETGFLFLPICMIYTYFICFEKRIPVFLAAIMTGLFYLILRWKINLISVTNETFIFQSASFLDRLYMLPLIISHYIEIFFFTLKLSSGTDFILHKINWDLFWKPLIYLISFLFTFYALSKQLIKSKYKKIIQFFLAVMFLWFILHGQLIIPLDSVYADRWFYIGVWGLGSILFIYLYYKFPSRNLLFIIGIIVIALGFRSHERIADWREPIVLYKNEIELHPWDVTMINNVGIELFNNHKILDSEPFFQKALELNPHLFESWNNLGVIREYQNNETAALEMYYKSQSITPNPFAMGNYANLLIKRGEKERGYNFLKYRALPLFPFDPFLLELWKLIEPKSKLIEYSPLLKAKIK